MISVNACHPSFDLSLEILCLLPRHNKHEGGVEVQQIEDDLGFRPGEFPARLKKLKTMYEIEEFYLGGARQVAVAPPDWLQARKAAQDYWDEVYGVPMATRLTG